MQSRTPNADISPDIGVPMPILPDLINAQARNFVPGDKRHRRGRGIAWIHGNVGSGTMRVKRVCNIGDCTLPWCLSGRNMSDYNPNKIESKWQKRWEEEGLFKARDFGEKEKYYALVEFPYPSGSGLHLGHCFNYALLDFLARKKRMEGKNVLCPIGWDAFGLPTENYAIRTGIHPREATQENTDNFRRQMKNLGFGFNWDREIDTTDPCYYRWTQWIFEQFFKHGLAYKKEMDINWCPSCKIGLANEEVIEGKCERCGAEASKKKLSQWLLKITAYADRLADELDLVDFDRSIVSAQRSWIGRSQGARIEFPVPGGKGTVPVFTTRADTLGGATFFVLAPEHPMVKNLTTEKKKEKVQEYVEEAKQKMEMERKADKKEKTGVFTGGYVKNPLTEEKIPVFVADYVMMDYGTGALMGVPAHDSRDLAFARSHHLPVRKVVEPPAQPTFPKNALDEAAGAQMEVKVEAECYTGEGKMVNTEDYDGLDSRKARKKIVKDLKKEGLAEKAVDYHLRDWIFSRQHYWGEPIPMIYCSHCAEKGITYWDREEEEPMFEPPAGLEGWFPVPENDLPLELPEVEEYQPTDTGKSPLSAMKEWVTTECPYCGKSAKRETDTMPNWAGSSWYYLRYCDPGNGEALADKDKLDYWMPVDLYIGGAEHTTLHLLYSRFWHKFLNDLGVAPGKEPYQRRRNRGLILGEDNQKMSKSKGNYVLPEEVTREYGADSLRTYLAFIGPYNGTFPWQDSGIKGVSRFLNRFYSFVTAKIDKEEETDKEIESRLHRLTREVGEDIEAMKFNTAVAKMMEFLNAAEGKRVSQKDVARMVKLIAPFAPHLAEEVWSRLGREFSVHLASWPGYDPEKAKKKKITLVIQIDGEVRDKAEVEPGISKQEAKRVALQSKKVNKWLSGKEIERIIFVPDRIINFATGE